MSRKVFISHSSLDKPFAKRLAADLIAAGHGVFLDEWVIKAGQCIVSQVEGGLRECDSLILLLSEHAAKSRWVEEEWKTAYWEDLSGNDKLVIVAKVSDAEVPLLLRKRMFVDFNGTYAEGLILVLEGLATPDYKEFNSGLLHPNRIAESDSTLFPEAAQLCDYMSDISESCWHAKWLDGLEYDLWHLVQKDGGSYMQGLLRPAHIQALKTLSDACHGWIVFGESGEMWVPMDEWERHYEDPLSHPLQSNYPKPTDVYGRRPLYGFVGSRVRRSLKQEALLFDKIAVPWIAFSTRNHEDELDPETVEFLRLVNLGIMLPSTPTSTFYREGEAEESVVALMESGKIPWNSHQYDALRARLTALQFQRLHGADAHPIFDGNSDYMLGLNKAREGLMHVILSKLPAPCEEVSWDEIAEYRQDPESRRRFAALRVWMNEVARRRFTTFESRDLLESLLADFETHMRSHRMKFTYRELGFILSCDNEAVNDLSSGGLSADLVRFLEASNLPDLALLDAELTAPGREVAYISFSSQRFRS